MDRGARAETAFRPHTLHGVEPATSDDLGAADVAVVGIPYDVATHPVRVGSRRGPQHIRENSQPERRYLSDHTSTGGHSLRVVDLGDVPVVPGQYEAAFDAIERTVSAVTDAGAVPLCLGGDGAVTLPQIRALARRHPDLVTIHFDAHTDCYPVPDDAPFTNATTFTHAAAEGLLDPAASAHIGVRGTTSVADVPAFSRGLGYLVASTEQWRADRAGLLARLREAIGSRPVFLSWDMDVFDPSVAPAVCTPEWGGLSAAEGIETIRALADFNIVGVDITTVSPPDDFLGQTGNLAARVALEILHILKAPGA